MLKQFLERPANENVFIRQALLEGIRLDGRNLSEFRDVTIDLNRFETESTSEVRIGNTLVIAKVRGELVTPFPDKPTEGIIHFSADVSISAKNAGISQQDIVRMLESSIRETDVIDTETLCVISGEKVWMLICDVNLFDYGGSALDACMFAMMGALRAFRKPEMSIVYKEGKEGKDLLNQSYDIILHSSEDREPLPLALHYTPLALTIAIFRSMPSTIEESRKVHLVVDPSAEEVACMDGRLLFFINAHRELSGMIKPGGVGVTVEMVLAATKLASAAVASMHGLLDQACGRLEAAVAKKRQEKLLVLQQRRKSGSDGNNGRAAGDSAGPGQDPAVAGIDRNDPLLAWTNLHQSAALREAN